MAENAWPETRWSLLRLLAHEGTEAEWNLAWERFVRQYSPGIVAWCRTWGLSQHEGDLCQNVFLRIHPALRDFEFRRWFGWLLRAAAAELLAKPQAAADPLTPAWQPFRAGENPDRRLMKIWLDRFGETDLAHLARLVRLRRREAEQLSLDVWNALRGADPASAAGALWQAVEAGRGPGGAIDLLTWASAGGLPEAGALLLDDLVGRLRQTERAARAAEWAELELRAGPVLADWCRDAGLAGDVIPGAVDQIATALRRAAADYAAGNLPTSRPDFPRFRGWFFTVLRNARNDCLEQLGRAVPSAQPVLDNLAARGDFLRELERSDLRQEAEERVRREVNPRHWEMYRLMVVMGVPGAEVAARLGIAKPDSVWMTVKRVKDKVRAEILAMEKDASGEDE